MVNEMARHCERHGAVLGVGYRIDLRQAVTGSPAIPDVPPTGWTIFAVIVGPMPAGGPSGDRPSAGADGWQLPTLGRRRRPTTPVPAHRSGRRADATWVIPSR